MASTSSPIFHRSKEISILLATLLFALVVGLITRIKQYFLTYILRRYTNNMKNVPDLPPGPKPWPILGNLPEMLINTPSFRWVHNQLDDEDIACLHLGSVHVIVVRSPEIAREFLKKHDLLFSSRALTMAAEYSSRGFMSAIFAPHGEQWKKMRRSVSTHVTKPAAKLEWLREKRDQEADNLVRFNQCKSSSSSVVNVRLAARHYCGNVTRKLLFNRRYFGEGGKDGGPGFEEEEHVDSAFKVLAHLFTLSPSDYVPYLRMLDLDGHGKIVKESMKNIAKYQDPIVDNRVKQWSDGKKTEAEDILDFFILAKDSSGQHLSTQEIKAECAELMLAMVDNPSNAVEWALAEMINQPKILNKAVEELDRIVGKERLVQESDLPSLRYVRACAREVFRLHPVVPFLPPRVSATDVVVSGYFIPKDSHVLLSRVELGRNPKVWDEPSIYKPDRHLKDDNAQVEIAEPDLKFISFGAGRRGCIGVSLGSSMTLMLLARLLQGFSWSVPLEENKLNLSESKDDLFLNKPLHVLATPRLPSTLYPSL